ncbi:hypothetical protein FACS1894168_0310 [Deltaproteobacteria bacterium]|nr:hypothetical protein FACS1894168_0310 [Deltaproteobacteria bacterium]
MQGGKNITPILDKPLFQLGRHIGMNSFLGFSAFILVRFLAPADQPCPVQIGVFRGMQAGAGRIVRSGPAFPVVVQIAENAEVLFPARRKGIEGFAAGKLKARDNEMQLVVSGVAVPYPENIALIRLQPGKGQSFKVVHNLFFLLRRHLVVRVPGQYAR